MPQQANKNIGINIGLEVMMTEWYDHMRGEMDFQNPGRQVMEQGYPKPDTNNR